MQPPSLTIGIEEEYQIIDPETRELRSYITQFLEQGKLQLREQVKAEMHQSMVEVGTEVCRTPAEARAELVRLRGHIIELAAANGLVIAAAGSHPFSAWAEQEITPFERYLGVKQDMAELALPDAGVPHLRRMYARGRGDLRRSDLPGPGRQAVEAPPRQPDLPRLPDGADRGEQMACGALRAGRQADGPRQAAGAAGPRP